VVLTAATASSALASTVDGSSGFLSFNAVAGETNTLAVSQSGTAVTFDDSNAITAAPVGCALTGGDVTCPAVFSMSVDLGDLDDSTTFTNVTTYATNQYGEAGNDTLGATQGGSVSSWGGSENDDLFAGVESSALDGGTGNDILRGNGAAASSTSMPTTAADGADRFVGAAGHESVFYRVEFCCGLGFGRTAALTITLDGVANDGEAGEGDNLDGAIDEVVGAAGNDSIMGSSGDQLLFGGAGDDTLNGLAGGDLLDGDVGNDALNGADGDDQLLGGQGTNTYSGGAGIDSATVSEYASSPPYALIDQSVTLDGVANDGSLGEGENVGADVENVNARDANDSLIGNGAINVLNSGAGNDTIDGGAGNDLLFADSGDDTLRARDGFTDRVDCGAGSDTAVVDTLDDVGQSCEDVQRVDVGNANDVPEDEPPTVSFVSPAANTSVSADKRVAVSLRAADDHAVSQVVLIANGTVVGRDGVAPYVIRYQPRGADVGRNTLVAMAVDERGQTGTATRALRLRRFTPLRLTSSVTPSRERMAPYRFRARGTVSLPAQVRRSQGCGSGLVRVQIRRGATIISSRHVTLRKNCTYSSTATFKNRSRLGRSGRLTVRARFLGNRTLGTKTAPIRRVRAG